MFKKISTFLIGIAIMVSGLSLTATPALAASCTQYHWVQYGETLSSIGWSYGVGASYLRQINSLPNAWQIYAGQRLCVRQGNYGTGGPYWWGSTGYYYPPYYYYGTGGPYGYYYVPSFSITSVNRDTSVTIRTYNFPPNQTFQVLMGPYGSLGIYGIPSGTVDSGNGGSFTGTFNIPAQLAGADRIAIRLESTSSGTFAFNWFWNNAASYGTGGPYTYPPVGYYGMPSFYISNIVSNGSVSIVTNNFPPNVEFDVLMGHIGTQAVNGIKVGTVNSGEGGSFAATFTIPGALYGSARIAIRLENSSSGYYAYNWFYNIY